MHPYAPAHMAGSILGAEVKRIEDPRLVRGEGTFITSMEVPGALWMHLVRSPIPHGSITSIDADEARNAPGVVGVYTAADLELGKLPIDAPGQPDETRRPLLAADRVRFVGDIVAAIVAESPAAAADAADLVWVDYDELPSTSDPEIAAQRDAELLFPEVGSNVIFNSGTDTDGDVLEGADVVIRTTVRHQRLAAVPLETSAAVAVPRNDGDLDVWVSSQAAHAHRNAISTALGIDRNRIHLKIPDMGGGFGAKIVAYPEQALVAALALELGRPVRWTESRTENFQAMTHGRAQVHDIELGATSDGRITGLRIRLIQDAGAYPLYGAYIPVFTLRMATGPYDVPQLDFRWRSIVTNTTPVHAYRGAGRPEATLSLERAMDLLAKELGMDPAEVRRRNLVPRSRFPYVSAAGERYDTGDYHAALDRALAMAGYSDLRATQGHRRSSGERRQLGIGISTYVEVTAPGGRKDWGSVEAHPDGTVTVISGASSHGHSHETTFTQLISRLLKVDPAAIRFLQSDTDVVKRGGGTMGSRSMQMAGTAMVRAGERMLDKAKAIVAHVAEASVEDVVQFEDGKIGVAGVPSSGMALAEIAEHASDPSKLPDDMEPGLGADDVWVQPEATVPFGTHVSVVEVDTETGDVDIVRHIAVDDCGLIFNRMVVDGQVHGGVAQGVGQALYEVVQYDEAGNPSTANLTGYLLPAAGSLPAIEIDHTETPTDENPLGVKGIGEAGTIGSTPAVVNAVIDALAPFGIGHIDMPLTPSRVWDAIHQAASPA